MPIRQRSPKKAAEARAKRKMREEYFKKHGSYWAGWAPCQICGGIMSFEESDWAHKKRQSTGGSLDPENGLIVHGFRMAPRPYCHKWADYKVSREKMMAESSANCKDGGVVEWSPAQDFARIRYLQTGEENEWKGP